MTKHTHADTTAPAPDSVEAAMSCPDEARRLLALPAEQRPAWLNDYLGDMTIPAIAEDSTNPLLDVVIANTAQGEKNCTLVFPLDRVLAAAEHAASAPKHRLSYEETEAQAVPRLLWVKDGGTYLMSNGIRPTDTPDETGTHNHVIYADGWGPGTDPRPILGGDDFSEPLDLTTPHPDGLTLLGLLRAAAHGATHFHLKATFDDHYMNLTYITD
ncbi:DUF3085 domain-containing protein [Streptomyces sp. NPDC059468]|uniref:DUF3085 domain-containing protein n=1 Tax=Streptomyces sp. NPDC059468 TaxID=3346845 RepID=UPI00368F9322